MKKLEELGISPWPWKFIHDDVVDSLECGVVYSGDCSYLGVADGNLIAAAPKLYDAAERLLRFGDESGIHDIRTFAEMTSNYMKAKKDLRDAVAEAAGESEGANK